MRVEVGGCINLNRRCGLAPQYDTLVEVRPQGRFDE
jgi:hypothetical protein